MSKDVNVSFLVSLTFQPWESFLPVGEERLDRLVLTQAVIQAP